MAELKVTSWNPFTGCTKISSACKNCYAESLALKLNRWGTSGYDNKFVFTVHENRITDAPPLKRRKPTLYFINNMSDSFHEHVTDETLDRILEIVEKCHWHNFYMLTKRSGRMRAYFRNRLVPANLWLGVTVENKKYGLTRLRDLQAIRTYNKHICCEPLLEDLGNIDLTGVRLVVGGGESSQNARRTSLAWVESLRDQCEQYKAHFYWKSWGTYDQDGTRKGNGKSGCLVNGMEYKSFPIEIMPGLSSKTLPLFT
ncbi:DUF5131 family protein [Vibrio pacinii]|uniref:DUF5131 family protein n=1 Tax=Vibrio pacinii TaxID=170674 RepID=UPI00056F11C0|nr:DUF5131 family protein [Vibrio pacinii]